MAVLFRATAFSSSLTVFLSFLPLLFHASFADNGENATGVTYTKPEAPPPLPPRQNSSSFKPGIAVVVGLLTTVFSLTLLLLLYAKHCQRRNGAVYVHRRHRFDGFGNYSYSYGYGGGASAGRKNSGIDRAVIESLPVFRFGALSGHKDGLECAVCLARFERTEVLRLLPKCKHAFHVECVDTWLDAHSTCPLCRYRVDPEDILLIGDCNLWQENRFSHRDEDDSGRISDPARLDSFVSWFRRVSGRHSSAGEQASRLSESNKDDSVSGTASSSSAKQSRDPTSFRRSLDSSLIMKNDTVTVGCFDRSQRKDGLLLSDGMIADRKSFERRFEHRIVISNNRDQRWSDVRPSDLLYLRSEMIMSDSRKFAAEGGGGGGGLEAKVPPGSGRSVNEGRSLSEITSVQRLWRREMMDNNNNNHNHHSHRDDRQRQAAGVISRWLLWASAQSQRDVRSHSTAASTLA